MVQCTALRLLGESSTFATTWAILAQALAISLKNIDEAFRRVRSDSGPLTLMIAAIPSVAICWLIPRLSVFRSSHHYFDIRVIYAVHGQEVDFGNVDITFGLRLRPPDEAGSSRVNSL